MEPVAKKWTDWLFIIGLVLLIIGYLGLMLWVWFMIIAVPVYLLGAILVACSRKSWKVKLFIIIPTFLLNTTTVFFGYELVKNLFE